MLHERFFDCVLILLGFSGADAYWTKSNINLDKNYKLLKRKFFLIKPLKINKKIFT